MSEKETTMDQQLVFTVKDALGRERPVVRAYGDGSVDCPFCTYAIPVPSLTCANPWCVAHPMMPPARAQEQLEKAAAGEAERARAERQRVAVTEAHAERQQERARSEGADRSHAMERGACLLCLAHHHRTGAGKKFTRHRGECPRRPRSKYDAN